MAEGIETFTAILARISVRPGDRVVMAMENCFAAICASYAITSHDARAVTANARLSSRKIAVIIEHSDARFAVYTPGVSASARTHAATAVADHLMDALPVGPTSKLDKVGLKERGQALAD